MSPLYLRGYQDALAGLPEDETLRFHWSYRLGYREGLERAREDIALPARCVA